jgi:hypothetical protein
MHDAFFKDPAVTDSATYWMSDPPSAARTRTSLVGWGLDADAQLLPWGAIPDGFDRSRVLKLVLDHDDKAVVNIPGVIRDLPNLLWLTLPRRFVPQLTEGAIPPTVRTVHVSGGGKAALPKALALPGLTRLYSDRDGMLAFSRDQVPGVDELAIKFDPGGKVLREVLGMRRLIALAALPFSNRGILEAVATLPLRYLKASRGNLDAVEPLRECPSLTGIWLEDLSKLTSIVSLAELPDLRELTVTYCGRLRLDRSLLRMPALRKLSFFACRDIGLTPLRPEIERLGLEHFLPSGTT